MPKQKQRSSRDPEGFAKEYEKLPPSTTSQQDHEKPRDQGSATAQPDESRPKRKWCRKPNQRTKKKSDGSNQQKFELLVSYETKEVRLDELQKEVDEVVEIVRGNVEGILEREGKVEDLEIAADRLHDAASEFKKTGRVVVLKYWWRNNRCFVRFLSLIILVIMIGLAAGLSKRFRNHDLTSHDSAVPITNVTTEPTANFSTSFMQIQVTSGEMKSRRMPPQRRP